MTLAVLRGNIVQLVDVGECKVCQEAVGKLLDTKITVQESVSVTFNF